MLEEKVLIVSPECPACEWLRKTLDEKGLSDKFRVVDVSTPEGLEFAKKVGVNAVPDCALVVEDKGELKARRCTEEELRDLLK